MSSSPGAVSPADGATVGGEQLTVKVEFSGGLELLFGRQKQHTLTFPAGGGYTMRRVIDYLKTNLCTERVELFVADDSVRPGILVLINDTDWELEDGLDYQIKAGDVLTFISTLHGG